jgi:4-amino-4-deoxy-L-arabinose transferase-like glycosyltransferase
MGVAAALWLVYRPWFLNYDARYALLWARDLWQGHTPEYTADFAPTPHPLQTAASSLALPFGDAADDLAAIAILLCFGALVWLAYRLGAELFSPWTGVVAALVVATRPALERDAVLAYQDIPFAALVVAAVLLEVRRPRRGAPVLALLAVAGLMRPEAWVLGGLYALWLWPSRGPRERAVLLALAVAAPALWALTDWLVTGDALHSLHGTAELAEANDRRRSVAQAPFWTLQYLGYALREPLVVGVPIGLAFAWRHARRQAVLPLAVAGVMALVFAAGPLFGLPLIRRYMETPAVLLAVFYGLAVCGWTLLSPGKSRRRWRIAGIVAALLSIVWLPWHVRMLDTVDRRITADGVLYADLREAGQAPAVRAAFAACRPLTAGDHRPIPFVRWWLNGPPGSVGTVKGGASPLGRMLLLPRKGPTTRRIYGPRTFPRVAVPKDWETVYENRSWRVYAQPGCRA